MVMKKDPKCIFLMETKCDRRKIELYCRRLKFLKWFIVDARETAGGLALMLTDGVGIECLWCSSRVLSCTVKERMGNLCWSLLACYGTPCEREKTNFWENLERMVLEAERP